jgi:CrcB protein
LKNSIAVAVGGALGAYLRFVTTLWIPHGSFPYHTLFQNIVGSFVLGALTTYFSLRTSREWIKVGLGTGVCGGFTTFSTLAFDAVFLKSAEAFLLYISISLGFGLLAVFLGARFVRKCVKERGVSK